ncbi:hypothetical protein B1H29_36890 [Streptomyces pactum]|uniref:Uncharacterized protein n=1 Tax=Streptomyces pactum TaxID=68249 RepID=A0A1S6J1F0_9ACTN|nr:hypothetical protein B1H29_00165 [Streptomyces pactum]AQS71671.1 hypothetical protein B1H29_36890 [Streptomyces pactum]
MDVMTQCIGRDPAVAGLLDPSWWLSRDIKQGCKLERADVLGSPPPAPGQARRANAMSPVM